MDSLSDSSVIAAGRDLVLQWTAFDVETAVTTASPVQNSKINLGGSIPLAGGGQRWGLTGNRTRDLSHSKRESYL